MSSRGRVENNHGVLHALDMPLMLRQTLCLQRQLNDNLRHNLREAHGVVDTRNSERQVLHHAAHHTIGIR